MISSLTVHDKGASDRQSLALLPLIEKGARDERNFVKKAVSSALRSIGKRSPALRPAALATARRLAKSADPTARWLGKDALRDLERSKAPRKAPGTSRPIRVKS